MSISIKDVIIIRMIHVFAARGYNIQDRGAELAAGIPWRWKIRGLLDISSKKLAEQVGGHIQCARSYNIVNITARLQDSIWISKEKLGNSTTNLVDLLIHVLSYSESHSSLLPYICYILLLQLVNCWITPVRSTQSLQ
jgi:hypothetical protein